MSRTYRWELTNELHAGDHWHLDALVDDPPAPGSPEWLPVLRNLVDYLREQGGNWNVGMLVGTTSQVPSSIQSADDVFEHADATEVLAPPAVNRLSDRLVANIWQGEQHSWQRVIEPGVTEIVSFGLGLGDNPQEGFDARISFDVVLPPRRLTVYSRPDDSLEM